MMNSRRWVQILIGSGLAAGLLAGILALAPVFAQGPGGMGQGFKDGCGPGGRQRVFAAR